MTVATDAGPGWSVGHADATEWIPWGGGGARAKLLAAGDGFNVALVEADPGYEGAPHVHEHTEFLHVVEGEVVTNGVRMGPGDAYVAAAGSEHLTFTSTGARYLSIFKI
jgi:mannose-6-phosphate isomerase-like protein (cupin superfamily)